MRPCGSACVALVAIVAASLLRAQQPAQHVVAILPTATGIVTLLPTSKSDSTLDEQQVAARFDSSLRAGLASRRFTVVEGGPALAAWLRARDSLGGFYNRKTGHRLEPNLRSAARAALDVAGAELLLVPELEVVDVWIAGYKAAWDGAERRMDLVVGGRTAALSLVGELRDRSGFPVATLRSGFNTITRSKGEGLVLMTAAELFGDQKRLRECTERLADSMPGVPRKPPPAIPREDRPIP